MLACKYTLATPILILSPRKLPTRARPTSAYFDASLSQHSYYYSSLVRTELGERGEPGTQFLFRKRFWLADGEQGQVPQSRIDVSFSPITHPYGILTE
jgi:hypothetical protein